MTQDEARARVAKGAAHLDQVRPGWFNQIDTGILNLVQPCFCVLGQLYANFYNVVRVRDEAGRPHVALRLLVRDATSFGFRHTGRDRADEGTTRYAAITAEYRQLQDAWIEAICDRLVPTSDEGTSANAGATPSAVGVTESA